MKTFKELMAEDYSNKNPKIDIFHKNMYMASTNWSPTLAHAKEKWLTKHPEHNATDVSVKKSLKESIEDLDEAKAPTYHVYDNGGKTADRYTIIHHDDLKNPNPHNKLVDMLGMSNDPTGPHGISQFSMGNAGKHLGKKIPFESLHPNLQKHITNRYNESVELEESLGYKLPIGHKKVIDSFINGEPMSGKHMTTDGNVLHGNWLGGSDLAKHVADGISVRAPHGNISQTIHNAIHKKARKSGINTMTESTELDEAFNKSARNYMHGYKLRGYRVKDAFFSPDVATFTTIDSDGNQYKHTLHASGKTGRESLGKTTSGVDSEGHENDEENPSKEASPEQKRGRGRPRTDSDPAVRMSSAGLDNVWKFGGKLPKGKARTVHFKESVELDETLKEYEKLQADANKTNMHPAEFVNKTKALQGKMQGKKTKFFNGSITKGHVDLDKEHIPTNEADELDEKWGEEMHTPESKKGMFKGRNQASLRKELSSLRKSGPHAKGTPGFTKEKELMFALRAKHSFGPVESTELYETKKKIGEYSHSNGHITKVYKLTGEHNEGDPYKVELHRNGKYYEPADYFTNDLEDAHGTAKHMVKESAELEEGFTFANTSHANTAISTAQKHLNITNAPNVMSAEDKQAVIKHIKTHQNSPLSSKPNLQFRGGTLVHEIDNISPIEIIKEGIMYRYSILSEDDEVIYTGKAMSYNAALTIAERYLNTIEEACDCSSKPKKVMALAKKMASKKN